MAHNSRPQSKFGWRGHGERERQLRVHEAALCGIVAEMQVLERDKLDA